MTLQTIELGAVLRVPKLVTKDVEAVTGGVLQNKLFLNILQYSQENNCVGVSFLIRLQS